MAKPGPASTRTPDLRPAVVAFHMSTKVQSVMPSTPLRSVMEKMETLRISCVVVCHEGKPVGIVTERDLLKLLRVELATASAGDVMSSQLTTIRAQTPLSEAIGLAQSKRIRHFPVVNDFGALVGIITQTDLLRASDQR